MNTTINYKRNPPRNPDLFLEVVYFRWSSMCLRGGGGPPFTNQDPTLIYVFEVSVEQLGVDKERVHYPTVVNQHDGRKLARQVRER